MPYPKPQKQIKWAFAAEERGELPKGTGRRWARKSREARKRGRKLAHAGR